MCGPGDPEDFFYRGQLNPDGTRRGDQRELIRKLKGEAERDFIHTLVNRFEQHKNLIWCIAEEYQFPIHLVTVAQDFNLGYKGVANRVWRQPTEAMRKRAGWVRNGACCWVWPLSIWPWR
ncbi:MAG TPA: hypothetical protein EYP85_16975 [Armatimonadetes bacterium]|nr:hypothetical protein [Armatimonadota bacterium]